MIRALGCHPSRQSAATHRRFLSGSACWKSKHQHLLTAVICAAAARWHVEISQDLLPY